MISWLRFRAFDDETDWVARESYFQAGRLLENADRADVVYLQLQSYERLFVLPRALAIQRAGHDEEGHTWHDMILAGPDSSMLAGMIKAGIPGYRSHWEHAQSGDHVLRGDLDARIGYVRRILDKEVPFWRE
ncbi:MAG: hypothetical protein ACMXYM_03310 [Candidatus Woesearchaeota archaeon]